MDLCFTMEVGKPREIHHPNGLEIEDFAQKWEKCQENLQQNTGNQWAWTLDLQDWIWCAPRKWFWDMNLGILNLAWLAMEKYIYIIIYTSLHLKSQASMRWWRDVWLQQNHTISWVLGANLPKRHDQSSHQMSSEKLVLILFTSWCELHWLQFGCRAPIFLCSVLLHRHIQTFCASDRTASKDMMGSIWTVPSLDTGPNWLQRNAISPAAHAVMFWCQTEEKITPP